MKKLKGTTSSGDREKCKCDCHLPGQAHFGIDYHCSKCLMNPLNRDGEKKEEIIKENWKNLNSLMELRQKQFEEIYQHNWWNYLIEDEMYKFLCQKLVEIKLMSNPTFLVDTKLSEEDIKSLSSGFITVEDFIKDIQPL